MAEENKDSLQPQKRVERLIFRDELTDAFNRRYLYQYLPQEIARNKAINQNIWLFMIDIDDFKSVNDKYGHLRGDEVLKIVANILKECVRGGDTVIRYAGDEFTVILPGGDISNITTIAKRMNSSVSKTAIKSSSKGEPDINVNLSIGIANFPDDAGDALRLIDLADKALYISKQKGKNRISFVTDISSEIIRAKEILQAFPCPVLIEREEYLNKLLQASDDVIKENKSSFILISSDVGLGKSRLINEFSQAILKKGGVSFLNKCSEKFVTQPYRGLLLNLESYLLSASLDKDKLSKNLTTEQLSLLANLLPPLKNYLGLVDSSRQEMVENKEVDIETSLKQLLINISSGNLLCLVFDDFQWIDESTLKFIFSLKKEVSPVLIVAALRKEDLNIPETSDYPITRLKEILAETVTEEIILEPLAYQGTAKMISTIFSDMERSEALNSLIYKITHGNPLFIEELLKFLIQKGFIYYHKGHWGKIEIQESDIPHSLEEVILERFRGLDRASQELISKAAVIGQDFNTELLHRLGKQDEGYVLDILESAQRAGLIKKSGMALGANQMGEELSFVSDEIRRVLYGLIEQDKMKDLHRQLGEIEEGLYADNLNQIAGELFHHFKKAEDYHRATVYARMIKDAEELVYDKAIKYAKEILEGIEEKEAPLLSKKSLELIPDIVRQFYIININILLYPSGSEMITIPLEDLFSKLSEIFVREEFLVLSQAKDILTVNSQRLKEGKLKKTFESAFVYLLKSHHIESITFTRGLSKTELSNFIDILARPLEDKSLTEELKSKEIYQIKIQEISYVVASSAEKSKERERLNEAMLLDYLLGKISGSEKAVGIPADLESNAQEVAQILTQMADKVSEGDSESQDKQLDQGVKENLKAQAVQKTFQKIGSQILDKGPQDWNRYKKGLAKAVLKLEPRLRREVLLSDRPEDALKKKDIIKELSSEFPDEVIVDLLSNEFKEEKASVPKMRSLTQKFLGDSEQRRRIVPLLKDKMNKLGFPQEDLPWILGEQPWKDFGLEEKVKRFLLMSAQDYINLEDEVEINHLIAEVLALERQDLFNALLNKWKEFLKVTSIDLRRRIARSFTRLIDAIPTSRPELLIILFDIVFSQLKVEERMDIFKLLINPIAKPLGYLIDTGNFSHAKIIVERLNKEKLRTASSLERQKDIQELMEKTFQIDRLKLITAELIKRIDQASYYADIKDLIIDIAEPMVNPLIDEAMIDDKVLGYLGYFGSYLRRRGIGEILAAIINRLGPEAVERELKVRLSDEKWYVVKNTIELFLYLNSPGIIKLLESNLKHPDINIRKKTIFVLKKIGSKESHELLCEALKDSDRTVRLNVIQYLARIADELVLSALKRIQQPDLQMELDKAIESVEKLLGKHLKRE